MALTFSKSRIYYAPCARPKDTFLANISHTMDEPNENVRTFDREMGTFAHKSSKQTYI